MKSNDNESVIALFKSSEIEFIVDATNGKVLEEIETAGKLFVLSKFN